MIDSAIAHEFLETGRCASCGVIDLHAHYGHFRGIYMPNHDPAQMIATMDRCGVELTVSSGHTALADMVRKLGSEQILFGSGAPFKEIEPSLLKLHHCQIPDAQKELIAGGNARRLLGL